MRYQDLKQMYGTQGQIAAVFGVTQGAVSVWRKKGIPIWRQWQIQLVTGGRLVAESLREPKTATIASIESESNTQ